MKNKKKLETIFWRTNRYFAVLCFIKSLSFMSFIRIGTFTLLFFNLVVFGQVTSNQSLEKNKGAIKKTSNILFSNSSDTVFLNIELNGASYDLRKNKLPYYMISKRTSYDQLAKPFLNIKRTDVVSEPHASVIKKYFSKYLTGSYQLEAVFKYL